MVGIGIGRFQKRKAENPSNPSNTATASNEDTPGIPNMIVAANNHRRSPSDVSGDWGGSIVDESNSTGDDLSFAGSTGQDFFFPSTSNDFMDETDNSSYFGGDDENETPTGAESSLANPAPNPTTQQVSAGFSRFASRKPALEATKIVNVGLSNSNVTNVYTNRAGATAVTPNNQRASAVARSTENRTPTQIQEASTQNKASTASPMPLLHSITNQATNGLSRDKTRRVSLEQSSAFPRGQDLSKTVRKARPQPKQLPREQIGTNLGTGDKGRFQPRNATKKKITIQKPRPNTGSTTTAPLRDRKMSMFLSKPAMNKPMTQPENPFANVTDNRTIRKKILGAKAVTPNPRIRKDATKNRKENLSPQPNEAKQTHTKTPITAIENSLTREPPAPMDLAPEQQEPNAASENHAKKPSGAESSLESNQAEFLSTVRETEDLQEKIETELLGLNDRFSDTYSLLLRDLEAAVDLMDRLETIQEEAEEAIALHRQEEIL